MEQLLSIRTVPIQIEMKVNHAKLEYVRGTAELEINRNKGGLSIHSRPIRLNLDTFEARNSICPTTFRSVEQAAQKGLNAVYEVMETAGRHGQLLLKAQVGEELETQFSKESTYVNTELALKFLPTVGPEINWDPSEMSIRYEMDKLNFDWKMNEASYEFIPGNIEISITQHPDVVIEYIGGPLYVPPSADPNYEPIDVNV